MTRKVAFLALGVLLAAALAFPQAGSGRLDGVVKDAQGLVLPGATVTLTGAGVMGQRTATSDVDGSYRFLAIPPGTYNLTFELSGFQTFRREGIIVASGVTFTIDANLQLATVSETVTVTGESPVVDVKTTGVSATFDTKELQEIPSATDMWSVLGKTPGIRMSGFDVGGSHKSQQTGYDAFGVKTQNIIVNEGVNNTEATSGTGGYYDYYAIDEYRVSAQGADVEMSSPGAHVVATWKSGSNEFSSLTNFDFETEGMVTNNIDSTLEARGGSAAPVRGFHELHTDVGGPVVKDKFWFYGAYNHFKIDKIISGRDPSIATDIGIFDEYTAKINWQLTQKDQFIGFGHWSRKQKPFRGLSLTIPAESIRAQDSWSEITKAEWQRVWSDRLFSTILVGYFGLQWPMVPAVDPATNPPRIDVTTGQQRGAGWQPFTSARMKPQSNGQFNYYLPAAKGSHDFKFGYEWVLDSYSYGHNTNSGTLRYRDLSSPRSLQPLRPGAARTRERDRVLQRADVPGRPEHAHRHLRSGHLVPEQPPDSDPRIALRPSEHALRVRFLDAGPRRFLPAVRCPGPDGPGLEYPRPSFGGYVRSDGQRQERLEGVLRPILRQRGIHDRRGRPRRKLVPALPVPRSQQQRGLRRNAGARSAHHLGRWRCRTDPLTGLQADVCRRVLVLRGARAQGGYRTSFLLRAEAAPE